MCAAGIVMFFNFSVSDFLTPGFVQKGIVLENYEIKGDSSYVGVIHVDQTGIPYSIILSDNGSPANFMYELEILKRIYCMKQYSKKVLSSLLLALKEIMLLPYTIKVDNWPQY